MFKNIQNINKMVFGAGSFNQLDDILQPKRANSNMVFLLDDYFADHSLRNRLPLKGNDQLILLNVDDEPKTQKVDDLKDQILSLSGGKPNGIVGIGAGSVMDYAKAVAVMLNHDGKAHEYQGLNIAYNPSVYHVGIPTLSGTGAEVSTTAVLTGPEKKLGIKYEGTPFQQIVLDPELIADAPKNQRFYTGMDCYIHNIEALTGTTSNYFSDALADQSLVLCRDVYLNPDISREEADAKLMVASYLGGMSLSYSEVGICHALSYALSYVLDYHHGIANCIAFNKLEEFYGEGVQEFHRMVEMHDIFIPENVCTEVTNEQMQRMIDTTFALDHMWKHAIGEDWPKQINRDKLEALFRRM